MPLFDSLGVLFVSCLYQFAMYCLDLFSYCLSIAFPTSRCPVVRSLQSPGPRVRQGSSTASGGGLSNQAG